MKTRVELFLDKYPWLLPATGFISGWVSFTLVHRGDELATLTAFIVVLGWIWLMLLPFLTKISRLYTGKKFTGMLASFISQSIQQEILFFALPFLILSTALDSIGQISILIIIFSIAALSTIDPIYEKYIASNRFNSLTYHSLCSFISALVIFPIVLKTPTGETFFYALAFVVFGLFTGLFSTFRSYGSIKRKIFTVSLLILIPGLLIGLRAYFPAAGIIVTEARITDTVTDHEPGNPLSEVSLTELGNGLFAYARVTAPKGLQQTIVFNWSHNSYEENINTAITGGRDRGYRTYSHKKHFIPDATGHWTVEIMTPQGQLLEHLDFTITD